MSCGSLSCWFALKLPSHAYTTYQVANSQAWSEVHSVLEIKVNVSEQLLRDKTRWLKLRSLLVGEEGDSAVREAKPERRRVNGRASTRQPAAVEPASSESPRLVSNLQKAAYALQKLHEGATNPAGYTAHQMALYLREQNIDAISAEQLSWALSTMVSRRQGQGRVFAQRIRRGRYLPTEHTADLFATNA